MNTNRDEAGEALEGAERDQHRGDARLFHFAFLMSADREDAAAYIKAARDQLAPGESLGLAGLARFIVD